jgi:hypothetical protein
MHPPASLLGCLASIRKWRKRFMIGSTARRGRLLI